MKLRSSLAFCALVRWTVGCAPSPSIPGADVVGDQSEVDVQVADSDDAILFDAPEIDAIDDGTDTSEAAPDDAPVGSDGVAYPVGTTVVVTADTASLTPPPLATQLSATVGGKPVTELCVWTIGPAEVCTWAAPNGAFKIGVGSCSVKCMLPGGATGTVDLKSAPQPVLYLLGGSYAEPNSAAQLDSGVSRLRIDDKQWDAHVTQLPYVIYDSAAGGNADHLYLVGGKQPMGNLPPPVCPSSIPGCVGSSCKDGCSLLGPDGAGIAACPKESVEHPEKDEGCGTIWRLDLADASWHAVGALMNNQTYVGDDPMVGNELFLGFGGVLDVTTGQIKPMKGNGINTLGEYVGSYLTPFGDSLVAGVDSVGFDKWSPVDGSWTPFLPSRPCTPKVTGVWQLASMQLPVPTLVWSDAWGATLPDDCSGASAPWTEPLAFRTWTSTGSTWVPGPKLPMNITDMNMIRTVSWSGGVFYVPTFKASGASSLQSTWLLASPGDHFVEFPPPPVEHAGTTMAVVVIQ